MQLQNVCCVSHHVQQCAAAVRSQLNNAVLEPFVALLLQAHTHTGIVLVVVIIAPDFDALFQGCRCSELICFHALSGN